MSKVMHYDAQANPDDAFVPGVRNADIPLKEWKALPAHVRARAEATGWWTEVDTTAEPLPDPALATTLPAAPEAAVAGPVSQ